MSDVIKINAITVPADSGDELAKRFAARAGAVDGQPGFKGFELLRPTDGKNTWLVVTRWEDEASFEAWTSGQEFQRAHGGQAGGGAPAGHGHGEGGAPAGHGHGEGAGDEAPRQKPVGMSAELWSFDVAGGSQG
ncbi:antibiotic biosynthesis monooxygenase family protein [Kytococcus sedentarius]|uniref:antibiotic biosynthesis monooxygenase family protein n=1 Tax=Kytococcus sedentarius TaxID=1276 RepID=UPI0035BBA9E3